MARRAVLLPSTFGPLPNEKDAFSCTPVPPAPMGCRASIKQEFHYCCCTRGGRIINVDDGRNSKILRPNRLGGRIH
ncbi:hypothetical protein CEXT_301521 [Caerostris extrusa]|uniref:Uncharacterized protein n=1 Tax=Caerostris extrusa TaxID=172846 RepID=A0AAV4Q3I8_CAEEX|nr:hypothetical protein CEXT_301521 [Caerostris extrusa]